MTERTQSDEGWAPMHSTQTKFHFYARRLQTDEMKAEDPPKLGELVSLCGKWAIPPFQEKHLLPFDTFGKPDAIPRSSDCTACSRKLVAIIEKRESN